MGTGAACEAATDCQPGEGQCPSGPSDIWSLAPENTTCDNHCDSLNLSCEHGDWGVYDEQDFRSALSVAANPQGSAVPVAAHR